MGYLATTADRKRVVPRATGNDWSIYSDSDHAWGYDQSRLHYRSQTGVIILLNSMPIFWKSNKQPVTALSPAEAEVYAMMEAVKEARLRLWIAEEAGIEVSYPLTLMPRVPWIFLLPQKTHINRRGSRQGVPRGSGAPGRRPAGPKPGRRGRWGGRLGQSAPIGFCKKIISRFFMTILLE